MPQQGNLHNNVSDVSNPNTSPSAASEQEEQSALNDSNHTVIEQQEYTDPVADPDANLGATGGAEAVQGATALEPNAETSLHISDSDSDSKKLTKLTNILMIITLRKTGIYHRIT